eukprot:SAG31_NODE_1473_length_8207_cov_2.716330_5_plen_52_part_00
MNAGLFGDESGNSIGGGVLDSTAVFVVDGKWTSVVDCDAHGTAHFGCLSQN